MKKMYALLFSCALLLTTLVGIGTIDNSDYGSIDTDNVAGTYTVYSTSTYIDWSTGGMILSNKHKDNYITTSKTIKYEYDKKYQLLGSHEGPTPKEKSVSHTSGVSRTTGVKSSAQYDIFKLEASHTITSSKSKTVTEKITFPGDGKLHKLYTSRHYTNKEGYVKRNSYISKVKSYTYIWGVCAWNIKYTGYNYDASRSYSNKLACDTTEYVYGTYMD